MKHQKIRCLCEGAILVGAAQLLSYIKLWQMPWGGSIVLTMIPILLYAMRWGIVPGLLSGFVLGTLQFLLDGGFALTWQSILGDYIFAYTVLGLAGLIRGTKGGCVKAVLLGGGARTAVHIVVGATVWAEYMPDVFFGMTMTSPWIYSALYNLAYMIPNMAITLAVFLLLWKPMKKYFLGEDLTR